VATPTQFRRRGRWSLILGAVLTTAALATVAYADTAVGDGDGVTPIANNDMAVGGVGCNVATNKTALIAISRNGAAGSTNVFKDASTVTVSVLSVTGAGLSAVMGGTTTITLPSNWGTLANNTLSAAVSSTVTVNSSTPGAGSGTVVYRATGVNSSNSTINRDDAMNVSWTTGSCNTPPSVSVAGVTDGATYDKGSVPAATCEVTDAEDGNSSFAATLSSITGPYSSDGIGQQTASCSYTDGGGQSDTASATYSIVDPSPPSIGYTLDPASPDGDNGWWVSDVTLTWSVTDAESPNSLVKTGCDDQNITADQAATTYSCSATSAGGSAGPVNVTIKRDATKPTISGSASPAANSNGWNNTDVTVSFTCADNLSGVASCGPDGTLSSEGTGQSATGTAEDQAGNSDTATVGGINIDKTAPAVALVGGPADGGSYYFGLVPAAPSCTASDGLSGLDGSCSVSGYGTTVGPHTVTATATDKAGNVATQSHTYTVLAWTLSGFFQPVDMGSSVWNTVKGGSTVPLKFRIFAGSTELTDTSIVNVLKATAVSCTSGSEDAIEELVSTGGTSLRYDTTGGQFIYNWQTPKQPGKCYRVTVGTADGSSLVANFKLK
jgi:hypothetical protein